jgi:two-component system sensor histidine kinase ChiS
VNAPAVLLVDDEPPILDVLGRVLRAYGYAVRTASCGKDALYALTEEVPDVVLLDINLPDLTGWEVLRRLAPRDRERVPVIVLSASPLASGRVDDFHSAGVLLKPFPVTTLIELIERVINQTSTEESPNA